MCVGIGYAKKIVAHGHGTGSYPLPPHGWQRRMRRMASQEPLMGPYLRRASMAYWLQVGTKRQLGGVKGEMHAL